MHEPARADIASAHARLRALGAAARELDAYRDEPPMPSGIPGKTGWLKLDFRHDAALGRTVLADMDRRVPLLVQKALYWEASQPGMACVTVISTTGCVVQGDRLAMEVRTGPGAQALIVTQGATKIHSMEQGYAAQLQTFVLDEGSFVEYAPDPLILHRSSRFTQDTFVTLPASAAFVYGETVMPGRRWHHEEELFGFDVFCAGFSAARPDGSVLFEERMLLEPEMTDFRNIAVMGGYDICGTVFALMPERHLRQVREAIGADVTAQLAWGAGLLPSGAGLAFRVLGRDTASVQGMMRAFRSLVREAVLGRPLPPEFLWR